MTRRPEQNVTLPWHSTGSLFSLPFSFSLRFAQEWHQFFALPTSSLLSVVYFINDVVRSSVVVVVVMWRSSSLVALALWTVAEDWTMLCTLPTFLVQLRATVFAQRQLLDKCNKSHGTFPWKDEQPMKPPSQNPNIDFNSDLLGPRRNFQSLQKKFSCQEKLPPGRVYLHDKKMILKSLIFSRSLLSHPDIIIHCVERKPFCSPPFDGISPRWCWGIVGMASTTMERGTRGTLHQKWGNEMAQCPGIAPLSTLFLFYPRLEENARSAECVLNWIYPFRGELIAGVPKIEMRTNMHQRAPNFSRAWLSWRGERHLSRLLTNGIQ